MKNTLEGLNDIDLKNWLNLIFGKKQRYEDYKKKEGQFFLTRCYIDADKNILKTYSEEPIVMEGVIFGLVPLKIIFDDNKLDSNLKNEEKYKNEINIEKNTKTKSLASDEYCWDNEEKHYLSKANENGLGKININDKNKIIIDEIIDHSDEIFKVTYNRRLNMFVTCSFDGLICIYIFPKKLISIIRHPQKLYFEEACLSANPFPTVIAHDKKNCCLYSYSIYGILIKQFKYDEVKENINVEKKNFNVNVNYICDLYGGLQNDRVKITFEYKSEEQKDKKKSILLELPFFNLIKTKDE